jgi:predicted  nucleic acid-binding Zn-ribbon protein
MERTKMAGPSLEFLGKQIERLQVEMRHARAEIAALRNRVDASEVRIEEVVLLLNELRQYVEARFSGMEKAIDARFAQVHETMANNLQILLTAIEARK